MTQLRDQLHFEVVRFESVKEALAQPKPSALLLALPFSLVNYTPIPQVPTILITQRQPVQGRPFILASQLLDTICDYSKHNCKYIITLLKRIQLLSQTRLMICEGDPFMSKMITQNIHSLGLEAIVVKNSTEASQKLHCTPNIRMVLLSSNFNKRGALKVITEFRKTHNKLDLPILGLLDESDPQETEIDFLRHGVTDTLIKHLSSPSSIEIFRYKIMQNIRQVLSYFEMTQMAVRDPLTNLFNRRYFFEVGSSTFANFKRKNIDLAIAMIDIDNFKNVNDTHGHPMGDKVIVSLSKCLQSNLRETDIISRFGGEEFCIILTGASAEQANEVLNRIRLSIHNENFTTETSESFNISVSIGLQTTAKETLELMVEGADKLLYQAKTTGKNKVVFD